MIWQILKGEGLAPLVMAIQITLVSTRFILKSFITSFEFCKS